jgi:hypothetical protein
MTDIELRSIEHDRFLEMFSDPIFSGSFNVRIAGTEVPLKVDRREAPIMVIVFGGAIDRLKRPVPQFAGGRIDEYVNATVVRVADPSLRCDPTLAIGWYAGDRGFDTQRVLSELIRELANQCQAERIVFVGGSAGGFAALYYSWHVPGSVALVSNPQTNIERFHPWHRQNYRALCWPDLSADDVLSTVTTSDVVSMYRAGLDHTVIYLQSASDHFHIRNHLAPFLEAIDMEGQQRLLLRVGYWGGIKHALIPKTVWIPWLQAAVNASEVDANALQTAHAEYDARQMSDDIDQHQRTVTDCRLAARLAKAAAATVSKSAATLTESGA